MIVPGSKLLFWVAAVVLPFSLLAGVEPSAAMLSLSAIGALAAIAILDLIRAPGGLAGIGVSLPEISRMSRGRRGKLELRIQNKQGKQMNLRLALAMPREIESLQEDLRVTLPAESEWSRVAWTCLPRKRGNYRLNAAYVEGDSPLGFWAARKKLPANSQIRVYPNLLTDRKNLAGLFLNRGAFGLHAQRQVGKGREFEKLREYVPGDAYDEIHWKATAKRGRPITKVFQIERTQEVYVVIDSSRLTARAPEDREPNAGSRGPAGGARLPTLDPRLATTTLERFITAALVLGLAAEQQGDLFGLLAFSDKVESFVRARNGKAHYGACRDALYTLQPKLVTPDYDEVCTFIRLRMQRRTLLIFLTALDDAVLAESFVRNMDLIRRQHFVVVNMLQPPGVAPVFTNPNLTTMDELYQHLGGHLLWHNLRELEKVLQRRGVRFSLLKDERFSAELVSQYLNIKKRQLI